MSTSKRIQEDAQAIISDWTNYKEQLLEGLNQKEKELVSPVLENTRREILRSNNMITEDYSTYPSPDGGVGSAQGAGATVTNDFARYDRLFMPLVRRVMPSLLSMELVGNQPLQGPVGMVRTMRVRYSNPEDHNINDGAEDLRAEGSRDRFSRSDRGWRDGQTGVPGSAAFDSVGTDEASGWYLYEKYARIALGDSVEDAQSYLSHPGRSTVALEGNRGQPLSIDVVKQTVEAQSRKLSASWSIEAEQDAEALDGLDLESELISALSDEISRELDREVLAELHSLAGIIESYDYRNADGRYAGEKFSALVIALSELSNQIAMKTRRGGATWMVTTPQMLTVLRNASNGAFTPATQASDISPRESLFAGTLNGSIRVYVDLYNNQPKDYALLGYKGSSELDTGLVYAPYVPLQRSGIVRDPETLDPRVGVMTRYALTSFTNEKESLGNSRHFYARAMFDNLDLGFKDPYINVRVQQ